MDSSFLLWTWITYIINNDITTPSPWMMSLTGSVASLKCARVCVFGLGGSRQLGMLNGWYPIYGRISIWIYMFGWHVNETIMEKCRGSSCAMHGCSLPIWRIIPRLSICDGVREVRVSWVTTFRAFVCTLFPFITWFKYFITCFETFFRAIGGFTRDSIIFYRQPLNIMFSFLCVLILTH